MATWQEWTEEDWSNAEFCEDCGLPLLCMEPEKGENTGKMQCVYCTWVEDTKFIITEHINRALIPVIPDLRKRYDVINKISKSLETAL